MSRTLNEEMARAVVENIKKDMSDLGITPFELLGRITVLKDTDQFNFKEDESVWLQKKEKAPWVAEVYFDGVWCCDLNKDDSHEKLRNKYLKGFLKGYERGQIRINRWLAKIEDEKIAQQAIDDKKAVIKKIESLPTATPEEKMSKDIIKEIAQEEHAQTTN